MPLRTAWTILALLALLSGCIGGGGPEPAPSTPGHIVPDDCETPIWPGIRGREVDVAVDPNDRSRVAAAAMLTPPSMRDLPEGSDVALWNGLARSSDGGLTWTTTLLPYWPGDTRTHPEFVGAMGFGDPILSFAPNGDLYLGAIILTGLLQYNMVSMRFPGDAMEADTVTVFSRGGYREELNMVPGVNPLAYNDKNDQAVDPESGDWYATWMWRSNASPAAMSTVPVVVRSGDGGATWSDPVMLVDSPLAGITAQETNLAPAALVIGDHVVVVWSKPGVDAIFAASAPRGTLDFAAPVKVADLPGGDGTASNVLTLPMLNVASGPGPGGIGERAYIVGIRAGDGGPGHDVGLWWSDDGTTWQASDAPYTNTTGDQMVPTVAVGADGQVAVQFLTFSPDGATYHAVMSVSADGGATWTEHRMTSEPTVSANAGDAIQGHVGDYFGNGFTSAGLLGAWQDGRDGTPDATFSEIYACVLTAA